jgi:hypothetical protein
MAKKLPPPPEDQPQKPALTKREPSPSKLSRQDDVDLDINILTGLPQAEHERRTDDLTDLQSKVGLGWRRDMEWTPAYLLLMLRAGRLLTPAQHDRAMDYIASHYQYYPNPAQYNAAGLGVSVASLANEGADDVTTEEAELWDWYRRWAERLSEGYRVTLTLGDGSTHTGVTRCGIVEWITQRSHLFAFNAATRQFVRVRVEMAPKFPALMELIFSQFEPTTGKALQRMLDYTAIGDDYLRGQFKKASLAMIARRDKRASLQPTPLQLTGNVADDGLRVYEGILSLSENCVAYHSVEALQGALDEKGNPVFSDEDIENQKLWIENREGLCSYVIYLFQEKTRLEGQQRKEEERAAEEHRREVRAQRERVAIEQARLRQREYDELQLGRESERDRIHRRGEERA